MIDPLFDHILNVARTANEKALSEKELWKKAIQKQYTEKQINSTLNTICLKTLDKVWEIDSMDDFNTVINKAK